MLFIDPDIYHKYKDEILALTNAVQVDINEFLPEETRKRGLSDREIAEKLGLDEEEVREIRCVAERQSYPLEEFDNAIKFKEKACRTYSESGLSHIYKPGYKPVD